MDPWYFWGFLIFTSCPVVGETPQYVLKGLQALLIPTIPGQPEYILWKHEGNKVVEFDGFEERVYSTYINRVVLDWHRAELIIKDLRHEDTGRYDLEVTINKRLHSSRHDVVVTDEVAEPTISCEVNDSSSSDTSETQAVLTCSAETRRPPALMKFEWKLLDETKPGRKLPISLGGKHDDSVYYCVVSNPLSAKNTSFTPKDCYSGNRLGLIIGVSVCIVLLCAFCIIFGLCWIRRRGLRHRENGRQVNCPTLESPVNTPRPQENRETPDYQAPESPEDMPKPGNVANRISFYNQKCIVLEEKRPNQNGHKVYSAKKKLSLSNSPADTQKASDKESDADPEREPLLHSAATLPSKQPLANLNTRSQTAEPEDASSHHEEDADSDQVVEELAEEKLPETNSSGFESTNEVQDSVGKSEEDVSCLQSDQKETDRPVSEDGNESDTGKEMGEGSPQQPQSPTVTVPESTDNTSTIQDQQDANNQEPSLTNLVDPHMTDPNQESKIKCDAAESEEDSDSNLYQEEPGKDERLDEPQTSNEKSEVQSDPDEGEARDEKLSEDDKGLMTGTEEDQDRAELENKNKKEANESEIPNRVEPETKEEEADLPDKEVESDKSGEDLQDNPKEDQNLDKKVPHPENQDGKMDSREDSDQGREGGEMDKPKS